jgi:hypothetical protein
MKKISLFIKNQLKLNHSHWSKSSINIQIIIKRMKAIKTRQIRMLERILEQGPSMQVIAIHHDLALLGMRLQNVHMPIQVDNHRKARINQTQNRFCLSHFMLQNRQQENLVALMKQEFLLGRKIKARSGVFQIASLALFHHVQVEIKCKALFVFSVRIELDHEIPSFGLLGIDRLKRTKSQKLFES